MANLPADLPENWTQGQTISPNGTEVGLTEQHGYNYLMEQVNATQEEVNNINTNLTDVAQETTVEGIDEKIGTTTDTGATTTTGTVMGKLNAVQTDLSNINNNLSSLGGRLIITENTSITLPDDVTEIKITACAGGGGGGGACWASSSSGGNRRGGGGGGGGAYVIDKMFTVPLETRTLQITVGTGGTAGTAAGTGTAGGAGGNTTIGSILTLNGGAGGGGGATGVAGTGGAGGTGTNGAISGGNGQDAPYLYAAGASGSSLGRGQSFITNYSYGDWPLPSYGAGGRGGYGSGSGNDNIYRNGIAGADGIVIISWGVQASFPDVIEYQAPISNNWLLHATETTLLPVETFNFYIDRPFNINFTGDILSARNYGITLDGVTITSENTILNSLYSTIYENSQEGFYTFNIVGKTLSIINGIDESLDGGPFAISGYAMARNLVGVNNNI